MTTIVAVAAVVFTGLTLRTTEDQSRATQDQVRLSEQGQLSERFGKAVEQLGSDKLDIRLGGLYSLERLAGDSYRDSSVAFEIITSFIRERTEPERCAKGRTRPLRPRRWEKPAADFRAALVILGRRNLDTNGGRRPDLSEVCLGYLNLPGISLRGINFMNASIDSSNLSRADFTGSTLVEVSAFRATLDDSILDGVDITGADFGDASLQHVDLTVVKTYGDRPYSDDGTVGNAPSFRGTDLSGANLARLDLNHIVWQPSAAANDIEPRRANLSDANLSHSNLDGANLRGVLFVGATLDFTRMRSANLAGADLGSASLRYADLTDAGLDGANFAKADLTGIRGLVT